MQQVNNQHQFQRVVEDCVSYTHKEKELELLKKNGANADQIDKLEGDIGLIKKDAMSRLDTLIKGNSGNIASAFNKVLKDIANSSNDKLADDIQDACDEIGYKPPNLPVV